MNHRRAKPIGQPLRRRQGAPVVSRVKARLVTALIVTSACWLFLGVSWAGQNAAGFFEDGKRLLRTGDYAAAAEAFSRAIKLLQPNERNAQTVRLARAQAYTHQKDFAKAGEDINAVLRATDTDQETKASALHVRGSLNLQQKRFKQALSDFNEAIKIPHDNESLRAACFADRGISFINSGDAARASSDLTKAIQLNPKSEYAYAARALAHLRADKLDAAKKDAATALKMNPGGQAEKLAREVERELSASASGPAGAAVPLDPRGHVYVQVRFSKKGQPHRFLLDTGATNSLIDRALLKQISQETKVYPIGKTRATVANGSSHVVIRYRVKTAFLYHLPLGEIEVGVLDRPVGKLDHLLGMGSLRNVTVTIDNANRMAEIRRSTEEGNLPSRDD